MYIYKVRKSFTSINTEFCANEILIHCGGKLVQAEERGKVVEVSDITMDYLVGHGYIVRS